MTAEGPEPAPILLVEDEAGFRHIMAMMLSQAGFRVSEAGNGAEALRILKATPAALVITDIVMPDMEGMELIRKLRQSPSVPRILAISGGGAIASGDYLHAARLLGADAVLAKPFTGATLVSAVKALLQPASH
jgi:DNA-binding response OmpR family regulator